jgi:hypothetical protein
MTIYALPEAADAVSNLMGLVGHEGWATTAGAARTPAVAARNVRRSIWLIILPLAKQAGIVDTRQSGVKGLFHV